MGLLALAACDDERGAVLAIDGKPAGITFDRVELYFGSGAAIILPVPPSAAVDPQATPRTGLRYSRVFAATDVYSLPSEATHLELYLPPSQEVTKYVGVVAYAGTTPVGIGEVTGYELPTDKLYQYVITLAPFVAEHAEVWGEGNGPSCLYWPHPGGKVVAVVRAGDLDCDDVRGAKDCDELVYCADGSSCPPRGDGSCVHLDGNNCLVGTCVQGQGCVDEVCGTAAMCDNECAPIPVREERYACAALDAPSDHYELALPVDADTGALCSPITVAAPDMACANAQVEAPDLGVFPDLEVTVDPSQRSCTLTITSLITQPFVGDHHVYLTFDAVPNASTQVPRWSVVFGLIPGPAGCDGTQTVVVPMGVANVASCPRP